MRRTWMCAVLVCACFDEPERTTVASSTIAATTSMEESSSSAGGETSSSEDSSSSEAIDDPSVCPEWCTDGCDDVIPQVVVECRCVVDAQCHDGLSCDRPGGDIGHCR